MALRHVFLDMDGVLVDFHHGFQKLCGVAEPIPGHEWPPEKSLHEHVGFDWLTCRDKSREAEPHFWVGMAALPLAFVIVRECLLFAKTYKLALSLLTDSSDSPRAALGKIQWLLEHFPELAGRCCFTTDKTHFAHDDTLLIDDTPAVAEAFNKAGGRAIVIPQAWNHWKAVYGSVDMPDITALLALAKDYEHDDSFFVNDMASYRMYRG